MTAKARVKPALSSAECKVLEDELRDCVGEIGSTDTDVVVDANLQEVQLLPVTPPEVDMKEFLRTIIAYFQSLQVDGFKGNSDMQKLYREKGPITFEVE